MESCSPLGQNVPMMAEDVDENDAAVDDGEGGPAVVGMTIVEVKPSTLMVLSGNTTVVEINSLGVEVVVMSDVAVRLVSGVLVVVVAT